LQQACSVVVVDDAEEDAGLAFMQRGVHDARPLDGFPGRLEEQALLRVDGQGFTGADPEERWIEVVCVVEEAPFAHVDLARGARVWVVKLVEVKAATLGEASDGVGPIMNQLPELFGGAYATGVAAAHGDDRDGLILGDSRASTG
jgi:hypothetical protein